jgi:hypothetical protein
VKPHRFLYALIVLLVFWLLGGLRWMERVFPPRRPRFMPTNSVWIEAPPLPISWHHGWWFGCDRASSGTANYCRLIRGDGEQVYAGKYLPCRTHVAIAESNIHLVPPANDSDIWLFRWEDTGMIGFLSDGDLLLPPSLQNKCDEVKERLGRR